LASAARSFYNHNMNVVDRKSRKAAPQDQGHKSHQHHDHAGCAGHGAHVEGLNLTPGRQAILDLLCAAARPLGAYDMIEQLASATGRRPAPISIYRALDYLLEHGLVHRLATRNAFVACGHRHSASEPILFLICDSCGKVDEATSPDLAVSLGAAANSAGFHTRNCVIELAGRCAACREQHL
jgi:Fur family zinc uptake transcriptional regulator